MRLLIAIIAVLSFGRAEANPRVVPEGRAAQRRPTVHDVESAAVRMAGLLTAPELAPPRWAAVVDPTPEPPRDLHPRDEAPAHLATATISITVPEFERLAPQALVPVRVSLSFVLRGR